MAGRRKKPLSIVQHKMLAEELQSLRKKSMNLTMQYQEGLNSREVDALIKISRVVDHARSVLEDRAFRDHPDLPDPLNLYYGRK